MSHKLQIITIQKGSMAYVKMNYIFADDVLKKIGLDPNLLQENCRYWTVATWEDTERPQGPRWKGQEKEKTTVWKKEKK